MKIDLENPREIVATDNLRQHDQHATVCFRGALRSQVRIPGQSKRVIASFRKGWIQTAGFSSSHSE